MNTPVLMFISYRHAEARIMAAVAAAGYDDITLAQARVMARIGPDGTRLTDLAAQAQVTKQSASSVVELMERAGYVERVPDPTDGRARLIRLADRGRSVQRVARREEETIERDWTRHLGEDKMSALRESLGVLRGLTDPWG